MNDFEIGVTKLQSNISWTPKNWFKLERGENLFRVLPPVHSLAKSGKIAQFYAYHGGFKNTKGKVCHFQCVQITDRKSKTITQRCSVCDMVTQLELKYKIAKEQPGVSQEQLKQFNYTQILPFKVQKRFFLNAINASNEIGILQIPYKSYMSLDTLLKKQQDRGLDPTGMRGAFLNFDKQSKYDGDPQVNFSVALATEQKGDDIKIKSHELTPEIIQEMKTKTVDLGTLYKTIDVSEVDALVNSQGEERTKIVDRLFGRPETAATPDNDLLSVDIPGTDATAVGRVEYGSTGLNVVAPQTPAVAAPVAPQSYSEVAPVANVQKTEVARPATAPVANTTPAAVDALSNDDFLKMFMPKQ